MERAAEGNQKIRLLLVITGVLVVFHLVNVLTQGASIQFERLFDLDGESNIPTWFSTFLLILSGITAYRCLQLSSERREKATWTMLAVTLFYLSCDEAAMIHENLGLLILKYSSLKFFLNDAKGPTWPFVLGPLFLLVVGWLAFRVRASLKGSSKAAVLLSVGGLLWISGAVVFETMQSLLSEPWLWVKKIEIVFEESFELVGAIAFLAGLLAHENFLWQNHFEKGIGIEKCRV